jgi:hypothetical protein
VRFLVTTFHSEFATAFLYAYFIGIVAAPVIMGRALAEPERTAPGSRNWHDQDPFTNPSSGWTANWLGPQLPVRTRS